MKVRYNVGLKTSSIDGNVEWVADKVININYPVEDKNGASLEYVRDKLEEFYNDPVALGKIDDIKILQMKGPDITHNSEGLFLTDINNTELDGVLFNIDEGGRGISAIPLHTDNIDPEFKIPFGKLIDSPTNVEGYGIEDLALSDKFETLDTDMFTDLFPRESKSPVPFSRAKDIFEESNYRVNLGDVVMKLSTPDLSQWVLCNNNWVEREDAPDLVSYLAGELADRARVPDCRVSDEIMLNSFSVPVKSYIKARKTGEVGKIITTSPT